LQSTVLEDDHYPHQCEAFALDSTPNKLPIESSASVKRPRSVSLSTLLRSCGREGFDVVDHGVECGFEGFAVA
jgi:hypothetical protein